LGVRTVAVLGEQPRLVPTLTFGSAQNVIVV
jgi:hypothetical protein